MVQELDLEGKVVLVRVDFNVPVKDKEITDLSRIKKALKASEAYDNAKQIIFMSHFGKPQKELKKGKDFDEIKKELSLKIVADYLSEKLDDFSFVNDCLGEVPSNKYILLENLRFHAEEEGNDSDFSEKLSHNADVYVNDAFGACHRAHASIVGVAENFKSLNKPVAAGLLLQEEIKNLDKLIHDPSKPFVAVLGGVKVSDKIGAIYGLMDFADSILIGGAMAYTFLKYHGNKIGKSLFEDKIGDEPYDAALKKIEDKAKEKNVSILLPSDHVVVDKVDESSNFDYNASIDVPDDLIGVDIGKKTVEEFSKVIGNAKTIFWNGPMGIFEITQSSVGTRKIAEAIAANDGMTVLGGGDTGAALKACDIDEDSYSFVSTGGGASLEYIELKGKLPGILALE